MSFPPFADMVPHAPPMVLLDAMLAWEPGFAECALLVKEGAPFVTSEGVSTIVCIEYMAQAVAACLGYEAFQGGEGVRVGMIIGCKRFDMHEETLPLGCDARVVVKRIRGNEMLSHFDGEVRVDDRVVASSILTLFHAEKPPE